MSETDRTEGRTDAAFTEANTGAESTYVHGGQRPLENPPKSGAKDVSLPVQDDLNAMHVDSKLDAQAATGQEDAKSMLGFKAADRSEAEQADLDERRAEGFRNVDAAADSRQRNLAAINDAHDAVRDRTLAVQEEISTRERDGAMPGTPAFARRQERLREIVGQTGEAQEGSPAERLRALAARLHTHSASGIEEAQHELMIIAAELDGGREKAA